MIAKTDVHHITNENDKYDHNSLQEAITGGGVYVYDVGRELARLFDDNSFAEWRWFVCDTKLSEERLKEELRTYLSEAECYEVTRDDVLKKLSEMEESTRTALKQALDNGGKLNLVPAGLKRKYEPDDLSTTVMLSDEDFARVVDEDVNTSVCEVAANAIATI